ncbi:hypothetical protein GUITHDRAFT_147322 [Guillardia theta CCMP2712]|uniref:Uncharacterized protein n=1 Tax=Guillardia theta (strain CCMP2712) TaxID=905079 RepID=L1IEH8_GUITC|nr:hypothetical protein GUITHDRAFT_147322 [Guillardia theta CCMP2712]EKX34284.1 hypothetical protein GUITHDRAFT_147322 [Guillardia theta CCMP2712]|eukprot:XP_005821264.1 hypothetical protein GUITHDRAFT_147322 [Guillardia theta CCMP2712]
MSTWISGLSVDTVQYQISSLKTAIIKLDEAHKALEGVVSTNTDDIQANATSIEANATSIEANAANIQANATSIEANTTSIDTLQTSVDANTTSIDTLQSTITDLSSDVENNSNAISTLQSIINLAENANNQTLTALFNNDSDLIQLLYDDQAATYTISLRKQDGSYITIQDIIDSINGLVNSVNSISNPDDEANLGDIVDTANDAFDIFSGLGDFASAGNTLFLDDVTLPNYYTKTEIDTSNENYYTKEYIDGLNIGVGDLYINDTNYLSTVSGVQH